MKSGYSVFWTDHALNELEQALLYLEKHWSKKEISRLLIRLEGSLRLISRYPKIYQATENPKGIRRAVILEHYALYYRIKSERIEVLSFFDNRQHPSKQHLKP